MKIPVLVWFSALSIGFCPGLARGAGQQFYVSSEGVASGDCYVMKVTSNPFASSVITYSVTTGNLTQVYTNCVLSANLAFGPGGSLYAVNEEGRLSVVDPTTAMPTEVTNLYRFVSGQNLTFFKPGFAISGNGTMYVTDYFQMYTVNPASGLCTQVGGPFTSGTPIYALAFAPNGTLFGVGFNLYVVNPATGGLTLIGGPLPMMDGTSFINAKDMTFGADGQLYMVGTDGFSFTKLYQVNTNTAALTAIGGLPQYAQGIAAVPAGVAVGAPSLSSQPISQTVTAGASVAFSVTAAGAGPLSYYWYHATTAITNVIGAATNSSFTITNVSLADAGAYFVIVSNSVAFVTSSIATLTVNSATNAPGASVIIADTESGGLNAFKIVDLVTSPFTETVLGGSGLYFPGMDFSPGGTLYGANANLYTISTNNWTTALIGPISGAGIPAGTITHSLAFSPSGTLYGVIANGLYTIDPATAQARLITNYTAGVFVWSIKFAPDGTLWAGYFSLNKLDPTTGAILTTVGNISGTQILSMAFSTNGALFATVSVGSTNLYQVSLANAALTKLGSGVDEFASIAIPGVFKPRPSVHALLAPTGGFQIQASIATGAHVILETSSDLKAWSSFVDTNLTSNTLQVSDPRFPSLPSRFYRLRLP